MSSKIDVINRSGSTLEQAENTNNTVAGNQAMNPLVRNRNPILSATISPVKCSNNIVPAQDLAKSQNNAVYDLQVPGFGFLADPLNPKREKVYFVDYLTPDGIKGTYKIGSSRRIRLKIARDIAREILARVEQGLSLDNFRPRPNRLFSCISPAQWLEIDKQSEKKKKAPLEGDCDVFAALLDTKATNSDES